MVAPGPSSPGGSGHRPGPGGGRYPGGPAGNGQAPAVSGTVESIETSAGSFTLLTGSGATETVDVSSSTTYVEPGVKSASLATLQTGDHVIVQGKTSSGTVTAIAVFIGNAPSTGGLPVVPGGWGGQPAHAAGARSNTP